MTTLRSIVVCSFFALIALAASDGEAQIRASERGGVFQVVDGTTIRLEYSRPQAKDRELFGGIVPWGKVWTGANWATTLEVDRDVTINGSALAAGRYSVWLEIQPEEWTAIIDPQPRRFHLFPPGEAEDQLRFAVTPEAGPHTEILTWTFPVVTHAGTTLRLAWGATKVDFAIGVQPSLPLTTPPELAQRYVGAYRLERGRQLGGGEVSFDIRYEDGSLIATWESPPNELLAEPYLVHLGQGMFVPGERNAEGDLVDVLMDMILEFTPIDGRATGFEVRAVDDQLWGTARRVN